MPDRPSIGFNAVPIGACFAHEGLVCLRTVGGAIVLSEPKLRFLSESPGNTEVPVWSKPEFRPRTTGRSDKLIPVGSLIMWENRASEMRQALCIRAENRMQDLFIDVKTGEAAKPFPQWNQIEGVYPEWIVVELRGGKSYVICRHSEG